MISSVVDWVLMVLRVLGPPVGGGVLALGGPVPVMVPGLPGGILVGIQVIYLSK